MNFIDDENCDVKYEQNHKNIIGGSVSNISLVVYGGNFNSVYAEDSLSQGYYTIKFYSAAYKHQEYFNIDV